MHSKQEALEILESHVKDNYQIHHAKMVALAMEAYAKNYELSDEEQAEWYLVGLLHDVDYYEFPEEHPRKSLAWFKEWGYSDEFVHAVRAHALDYNGMEKIEPESKMAAALIACDEMSGLLHAYSIMRPEGYEGMKVKSVKKKFKDKSFAAKINRDDITYGLEHLGEEFADHVELLVETFKTGL